MSNNNYRPPTDKDAIIQINGSPQPLGIITSSGAAVNNSTTATPFFQNPSTPLEPIGSVPVPRLGTLAGKVLCLSATAAGFVLASTRPEIGNPNVITVATNGTIPPAAATFPGVPVAALTPVYITMQATEGWLQFIPTTGSASLMVWESV